MEEPRVALMDPKYNDHELARRARKLVDERGYTWTQAFAVVDQEQKKKPDAGVKLNSPVVSTSASQKTRQSNEPIFVVGGPVEIVRNAARKAVDLEKTGKMSLTDAWRKLRRE